MMSPPTSPSKAKHVSFQSTGLLRAIVYGFSISFFSFLHSSNAATLSQRPLKDGSVEVILKGEIATGDAMRTAEYMDAILSQGTRVASLSLNSPGGVIYEGYLLAKLIRMAEVETVIRQDAVCFSACFMAFIAAPKKYAYYKAKIGVHSASDIDGRESESSAVATLLMVRFTNILGASDSVMGKMAKTPPSKLEILSIKELAEMGVEIYGNTPPVAQSQCQDPICEALDELLGPE